jgi:cytochrome b561
MPTAVSSNRRPSRTRNGPRLLKDTETAYGWISIILHWLTAVLIVYLLYLGSSIASFEGEARTLAIRRHTSVAIAGYALLVFRVAWRFAYGHPGPTEEQRGWAFSLGKLTHLAIVAAVAVMLVSGPLMQFSYGRSIEVFDWFAISAPFAANHDLAAWLHWIHRTSALVIFGGVILHIGGVYKHTAFHQDGTLAKIIIPGRKSLATARADAPANEQGET